MRTRKRPAADRSPRLAGAERIALAVLGAGALVIPTILAGGDDAFRFPKELVFRAEAILLLLAGVVWITSRQRTWRVGRGAEVILAAAVVAWAVLTTATSTNWPLSADSLITVAAAAVIFLVTCVAARGLSFIAVDVLMVGASVNAALVILQETKLWVPLALTVQGHYASVGLLGNANDVGTYLAAPAVAAIVVAVTASGVRRWIYAAIALLLGGGVIASGTRTALAALVAALIVFALSHSRRAALVVVAALAILAIPLLSRSTTIGSGVRDFADAARKRDYQRLLSERLVPFLAAIDMTRDHPLLGVGLGCFKYHYMDYRVALPAHYPAAWTQSWPQNFGEVHNDHLQVASETGLPGYALFLGAIAIAAGLGWPRVRTSGQRAAGSEQENRDPARSFARALRLPLAAAVFVVCLGQFPLELAAPRLMLLSLGALCIAWNGSASAPAEAHHVHPAAMWLLRAGALVAATLGIYWLCIAPYRGAIVEATVERRSTIAEAVEPQRGAIMARENLRELDHVAFARRLAVSWYMLYGRNCLLMERWRDAVDMYTRALRVDRRPEIYFNRALGHLRLGETDAAVADMTTAARFNPFLLDQVDADLRPRVAAAVGQK